MSEVTVRPSLEPPAMAAEVHEVLVSVDNLGHVFLKIDDRRFLLSAELARAMAHEILRAHERVVT